MSGGLFAFGVAETRQKKDAEDGAAATAPQSSSGVLESLSNEQLLQMHPITLSFQSPGLEAEYMADVAKQRRPVLMCVFFFDIACYVFRLAAYGVAGDELGVLGRLGAILPQLLIMIALHSIVAWVNWRSRRLGVNAARQEEVLLGLAVSLAISSLLVTLTPRTAQDYVYATMFLICTSSFLKIRWLWGTIALALPLLAVRCGGKLQVIPPDGLVHLVVAWAVGGLMSFLADSYRRQMFANQQLARAAAEKEIQEAKARTTAQRALADAQVQSAARALTVAKEKAANEAKSEFMSLMCHEVRTPLNGCLASAEMLLETPLEDGQRELAKTIRVSGSILLSTVSNFLDFFKMEAGKQLDVVRTEVELQELVSDVHCIIEAMIGRSSDVVLLKPKLVDCPSFLLGDPDRLRGILLNLYTNAAKFTRRGSISLSVSVNGPDYRPQPHDDATFGGLRHGSSVIGPEQMSINGASPRLAEMADIEQQDSHKSGLGNGVVSMGSGTLSEQRSEHRDSLDVSVKADSGEIANGDGERSTSSAQPPPTPQLQEELRREESQLVSSGSSVSGLEGSNEGLTTDENGGAFAHASQPATSSGDDGAQQDGHRNSMGSRSVQSCSTDADGWAHIVSTRTGMVSTTGVEVNDAEEGNSQWLFFEVADTGVGIGPKGLRALFKEFVQGSEDEMKRPRSKGGTGLGLSICSKQVAVLGGRVGVLSKPGVGSTFWFSIPLRIPDPAAVVSGNELRRTASWGSRDAFTDGHMRHHADEGANGKSGKRVSATARAHAFRKFHPAYKSAVSPPAQGNQPQIADIAPLVPEKRRNSAPEALRWPPAPEPGPVSVVKQVQRLQQSSTARPSPGLEPHPRTGSQAANFAAAKALLVQGEQRRDRNATARDMARASHDLRASLNLDRSRPSVDVRREIAGGAAASASPSSNGSKDERMGLEEGRRCPSIEEVREAALSMDMSLTMRRNSRGLDGPRPSSMEQRRLVAPTLPSDMLPGPSKDAKLRRVAGGARPLQKADGETHAKSTGSSSKMTSAFANAAMHSSNVAMQQPTVPETSVLEGSQLLGSSPGNGNQGPRVRTQRWAPGTIRPSMEARWRKLDISVLQGRRALLAEDNLINQKVAQMMLTSLGMAVEVANNGQEAVAKVLAREQEGQQFHVVLMDMAMPVMGGVEATKAIRRAGMGVSIVAMTANASDRDRDECMSAGMDGFLSKPVLKDRLAEAIMLVVSGRGRYNADSLVGLKSFEAL